MVQGEWQNRAGTADKYRECSMTLTLNNPMGPKTAQVRETQVRTSSSEPTTFPPCFLSPPQDGCPHPSLNMGKSTGKVFPYHRSSQVAWFAEGIDRIYS